MDQLSMELIKKTGEVFKENMEEITLPTSKSIGKNIGLLIDGIFGCFGTWGMKQKIKREAYLKEFKKQVEEGIYQIPEEKVVEPKANIIMPILETAKYYFEEDYYKDMFANLIIDACNEETAGKIHPSYVEIIKQLSPLDAKVFNMFKYNATYPVANLRALNSDKTISPCIFLLSDFKDKDNEFQDNEKVELATVIENLERLGLIVKNKDIIELNYNYDKFKENFMYKLFENVVKKDSKKEIIKYRIELTNYGRSFLNVCIK